VGLILEHVLPSDGESGNRKKKLLKRPKRKEKKKKFHRQTFIFFLAAMAGWLAGWLMMEY
jgi:hypothetical protein